MIKPENQFFMFGMGHREKTVYKDGKLIRVSDNSILYKWNVKNEKFIFDKYTVILTLTDGSEIKIYENAEGVFVNGECISSSRLNLPDFEEYKYAEQLRILHHEILISFRGTEPVPNIYVYNKAWYRDGAMMALVLEKTGNVELMRPWAESVKELYDRNNKGNKEPDNLGQLAFVLSFFVNKDHPMVKAILDEAMRIMENGCLTGITDYNHHEIYSTLWLKFGLSRLGINTDFISIPQQFDDYARMFWMDKSEVEASTPYENKYDTWYPYLWWARQHFTGAPITDELLDIKYPMSWEINASEADYDAIAPLSKEYAINKCGAPHSWHAAEMFMYLIEFLK